MEKTENEDFDYLVYFGDNAADEYRYCLKTEGNHVTYHRFLPWDFMDIMLTN